MQPFLGYSNEKLKESLSEWQRDYQQLVKQNLHLNMARGKPSEEQLDLSSPMLDSISSKDLHHSADGTSLRNYGVIDGIPEMKAFFANILEVQPENIIVGGNASLQMMYDTVMRCMQFGVCGSLPWNQYDKIKFLCPAPGYDRHFAICEQLGIEMIPIPMLSDGPDMDKIEFYVKDAAVKGIWCVPKYSNPTGITYSDDTVRRLAKLKPAAKDFRIFWDNAYVVHHLSDNKDTLLNIYQELQKERQEDLIFMFTSTSKITFPGAGVSAIAASKKNIDYLLSLMKAQIISYDKINQMRHYRFLSTYEKLENHMRKHAAILKPKFDLVLSMLEKEIKPLQIGAWSYPKGGYFISFDSLEGCAARIYLLCKEAGLKITEAGATFPYHNDPKDTNLRIAPSYPPLGELQKAMEIFCLCIKIASAEKMLKERKE